MFYSLLEGLSKEYGVRPIESGCHSLVALATKELFSIKYASYPLHFIFLNFPLGLSLGSTKGGFPKIGFNALSAISASGKSCFSQVHVYMDDDLVYGLSIRVCMCSL